MRDEDIKEILLAHKNELAEKYHIKEICVLGSYVRNQQKKTSDVDILVDFYDVPDFLEFIEIGRHLEELLGVN